MIQAYIKYFVFIIKSFILHNVLLHSEKGLMKCQEYHPDVMSPAGKIRFVLLDDTLHYVDILTQGDF